MDFYAGDLYRRVGLGLDRDPGTRARDVARSGHGITIHVRNHSQEIVAWMKIGKCKIAGVTGDLREHQNAVADIFLEVAVLSDEFSILLRERLTGKIYQKRFVTDRFVSVNRNS